MTRTIAQTATRKWTGWRWIGGAAVIAAIAIGALLTRTSQQTPAIAQMLPARNTVGFVAVESPDVWLQALDRAAASLSPDERQHLNALLSPEKRVLLLGFDPTMALGWQKIGVDPERGIAVSLDARSPQVSLQAGQLWVAGGPPRLPVADSLKWQTLAKWSVASLAPADLAAPMTPDDAAPLLDRDPVFRAAFADMPTGARTTFYAHADGILAALKPHLDARKLAGLEHVTQRVRGLSLVIAPGRTAGRIVLSGDGVESLRQIFGTAAPKQTLSQFLPQNGVLALRVSLNLPELFDGLMTWLPPQWLDARLGLASGRLGLLAMVGLDWTQLERALAGQAVVALELSVAETPQTPLPWLGLLAVRDAAETDSALQHLAERSMQRGVPVVGVQIAGHPGWQARDKGFVAVRIEDTLLLAPSVEAADRAAHRSSPLATRPELDGDVVLGVVFEPALDRTPGMVGGWRQAVNALEPLAMALRRDPHGLRLEASALPLSSLMHLAAWLLRAPAMAR